MHNAYRAERSGASHAAFFNFLPFPAQFAYPSSSGDAELNRIEGGWVWNGAGDSGVERVLRVCACEAPSPFLAGWLADFTEQ